MTTWKDHIRTFLYLHHRLLTGGIFVIGAIAALVAVYLFLFTAASVEKTQEQEGAVVVNKDALERITSWNAKKNTARTIYIVVPNAAFIIPTPVPAL